MALSPVAHAQICDSIIEQRAFNKRDVSKTTSIASTVKDDICSKSFDSAEKAKNAANSEGFDVGIKAFQVGASRSTQQGSQSYSVKESAFCSNSLRENSQLSSDIDSEVVVDVAIRAWEKCIDSTNASGSWLEYEIDPDGKFWTGFVRTRINNDSLMRKITSISIVPSEAKAEVECQLGGDPLSWGKLSIDLTNAKTAISCSRKNSGTSSAITLDLNTTSIGPVQWPSKAAKTADNIDALKLRIQQLEAMQEDLDSSVAIIESDLESQKSAHEQLKQNVESGSPKVCVYEMPQKITYVIPVGSSASAATCRKVAELASYKTQHFDFYKACMVDGELAKFPLDAGMTDYPGCKW
ncbi:MAG: hypothetical protein RLO80_07390 [Hyphomonas sp.]